VGVISVAREEEASAVDERHGPVGRKHAEKQRSRAKQGEGRIRAQWKQTARDRGNGETGTLRTGWQDHERAEEPIEAAPSACGSGVRPGGYGDTEAPLFDGNLRANRWMEKL
jgi:hypothetical protein